MTKNPEKFGLIVNSLKLIFSSLVEKRLKFGAFQPKLHKGLFSDICLILGLSLI
jgi:hypothetical protein